MRSKTWLGLLTAGGVASLVFLAGGLERGAAAADAPAALRADRPPQVAADYRPGRVLVKFKDAPTSGPPAGTGSGVNPRVAGAEMVAGLPAPAQAALTRIGGRAVKGFPRLGVLVVDTPQGVGAAIESLYRSGTVVYAHPDALVRAEAYPNDPYFNLLWGQENTGQEVPPGYGIFGVPDADMDAPEAWNVRQSAVNVIAAVTDTGIDYNHQDLAPNMWTNPHETPGNGIDDDANGYVDDVYGIDAYNNDGDPMDDHGHGSHVAGSIGAKGNNGIGVAGVAWTAKLMALKFLNSGGYGYTSDAIELMNYLLAIKAANPTYGRIVVNASWGGAPFEQAAYDALDALRAAGILFIAAAGNDTLDNDIFPHYPSNYDLANVIAVGATDSSDQPAYFSNWGCSSVDLFAPGRYILSTIPGNGYAYYSGTSMATPQVTGAAALIWAQYPNKGWPLIKNSLLNGVDFPAALSQLSVTQGRVNLNRSLQATMQTLPTVWTVTPNIVPPGGEVRLTGQNFGTTQGTVSFNGASLPVEGWANQAIRARVPTGMALGEGTVKVTSAAVKTSRAGGCMAVGHAPAVVGHTLIPHGWASGAKVGDNFWIFGGGTSWGQTGLVERYTLGTDHSVIDSRWIMPVAATNTGAAAIGSKVYVVGGLDWNTGTVFDLLQVFDTATGTWTQGAPLPQPLLQTTVVGLGNGRLYVFGGMDAFGPVATTYIYNPATNTWSTGAPVPAATAYAGSNRLGTTNKAWVMGGFSSPYLGSEQKGVYEYTAATNSWVAKPDLFTSRAGAPGLYNDGASHILFGTGGGTRGLDTGEVFVGGAWHIGMRGGAPLYTAMAGHVGTTVYVLNGYSHTLYSFFSNVWSFTE